MEFRLLDRLVALPPETGLFIRNDGTGAAVLVTAGQVRALAGALADALADLPAGAFLLHTRSLASFTAGLMAAGLTGRHAILPAHDAPDYLQAVGQGRPLVTDADIAYAGPVLSTDLPSVAADAALRAPEPDGALLGDPGFTFFTSGSTGEPKPVVKSFAQLDTEARVLSAQWPETADARVIATVPHHHIYGLLFRLFWPLSNGMTSFDQSFAYWEQVAARVEPGRTVLVSSPAHLDRIPAGVSADPLRIFSSGGPLPAKAAAAADRHLGCWPVEVLGSTETGGVAWRTQQHDNTVWQPLPRVGVTLADDGVIEVRSPFADGDGTCRLGDRGELLPDGRFRILGRVGPVVKVEGVRVSLVRIEQVLGALGTVEACRVIVAPGGSGRLAAVVKLSPAGQRELATTGPFRLGRALRAALSADLSAAERPKHWRFVPDLPVNDQGKTTLAALQALFDHGAIASDNDGDDAAADDGPQPDAQPVMAIVAQTDAEADLAVALSDAAVWFDGHFPGQPILPGIAQVRLAMQAAEQVWGWQPDGCNLMKLKFKQVTRPGDRLTLSLRRDVAAGHLWFRFACDGAETSSGRIGGRG